MVSGPEDPNYYDLLYWPADVGKFFAAREEQVAAIADVEARLREYRRMEAASIPRAPWPSLVSPEAFPGMIPARPYCADDYESGVIVRSRKSALKRQHIQFNGPSVICWMNYDVDRDDAYRAAEDANVPAPNIISIKPENGHGLLSYAMAVPVTRFDASRRGPIEWLADIQRGMTRQLGADKSFKNGVVLKNPLHCDWRTSWPTPTPYSLEDLDCALEFSRRLGKAAIARYSTICGKSVTARSAITSAILMALMRAG